MIQRSFDQQAIYSGFTEEAAWEKRAKTATGAANKAQGVNHEFDNAVWKELKPHLLKYFHGKCAYCEVNITAGFWGDVEHYRPKKKVEEAPGHRGYFWLAYHRENLMPSCQLCNQGKGKLNHFPLADENRRAKTAAQVAAEDPLLLNPYLDNPADHIQFEEKNGALTGYVEGRTPKGTASIKVYGLNREDLVDARKKAQEDTENGVPTMIAKLRLMAFLQELRSGQRDFAAARLSAVEKLLRDNGIPIR